MERTIVSQEYLLSWMNAEIEKYDTCNDCHFTSVVLLKGPDERGCNWSGANLRCSGVPVEICQPVAQEVVEQAKGKFNVM